MRSVLFSAVLLFALPAALVSQVPGTISYQGHLTTSEGSPLPDGNYKLLFKIVEDGGGSEYWREEHASVLVSDGILDIVLGNLSAFPASLQFDQPYELGIEVNDEPVSPNTDLTTSPYCFNAERLGGINSSGYLKKDVGETSIASAANELLRIENTGAGRGMTVVGGGAHGLYGKSTSDMAGLEGEGAGTGPGIRGSATANHGAIGYSDAADKAGVFGNSPSRIGVWGSSVSGTGVHGLSTTGYGVHGQNTSTSEWVPAVYGRNEGQGDGVYGWSQNRHGTYGVTSSASDAHAGLYGTNNGAGPAIKSDGDLYVSGAYRGDVGSGGAPFPRPAYDSGWVTPNYGTTKEFAVSSTMPAPMFDRDYFVVDFMISSNPGTGVQIGHPDTEGSYYMIVGNNDVWVWTASADTWIDEIRVRVWYYR